MSFIKITGMLELWNTGYREFDILFFWIALPLTTK